MMTGRIHRAKSAPRLPARWDSPTWQQAETIPVANFRAESSDHRPRTEVKLLYTERGFYGLFRVADRYVRSVSTRFQDSVCGDSCVEFFVSPRLERGYINFEFNCGGNVLCYFIRDAARTPGGFRDYQPLDERDWRQLRLFHTMPPVVEPEVTQPTDWRLGFFIPFAVFARYLGPVEAPETLDWSGNFYKCADLTSHPHWASWAPVDELNFHLPRCFGKLLLVP